MYTKKQKTELYIIFLLIAYAIEIFTFLAAKKGMISLYVTYHKPEWAFPLHWLVPIWTLLYTLIGMAGAKIWIKRKTPIRKHALSAWVVVMVLDAIWPIVFFYIPVPILTPILFSILLIALLVLLFNSFLVSRYAGYLIIPFTFMILYKVFFHWTFFILNIQLI